jgi:hypothetical protein
VLAADIAVLEVDEAYGPQIAQRVTPGWVVFTNIQVDQLNRFGEPEAVFAMLEKLAGYATTGVLVNGSDPNTAALGATLATRGVRVEHMEVSARATASAQHGLVAAPLFFDDVGSCPATHQPVLWRWQDLRWTLVWGALQRLWHCPIPDCIMRWMRRSRWRWRATWHQVFLSHEQPMLSHSRRRFMAVGKLFITEGERFPSP